MRKIFIICNLVFAILLMIQTETLAQVINACANHGNGTLRLVNSPEDCKPMETAISWNTGGIQGPPGPAGTACWDFNGNGQCDSDEDKNGGGCDASDCQGAPGTPGSQGPVGIACWDLNANVTCDLNEDKNQDQVCDALDCQGAQGIGSLGVYDKNDLYLGYLVSFDGAAINVFNPDIPVYFTVNNLIPPYISPFNLTSLDFTLPDCAGQATTGIGQNMSQLYYEQYSGKYYIVDFTIDPIMDQLKSRRNSSTGVCTNINIEGVHAAVKELTNFPFTAGTLTYPIIVRPMQ